MIEFIKKWWFWILDEVLQHIDSLNNDRLSKVANLLAIFLMLLGFVEHIWRKKRKNIIERMALTTKPNKALNTLENPLRQGEEAAELVEDFMKGGKSTMKTFKKYWEKFRGYLLGICLLIVYLANCFSGCLDLLFQNQLVGQIIAYVTLGASAVVFAFSDSFDNQQKATIKEVVNGAIHNTSSKLDEGTKATLKNALKNAKLVLKEANEEVEKLQKAVDVAQTNLNQKETLAAVMKKDYSAEIQTLKNILTEANKKLAIGKEALTVAQEDVTNLETALNA